MGVNGAARGSAKASPAAVLLDLDLAEVGEIVEDALPFEGVLRRAARRSISSLRRTRARKVVQKTWPRMRSRSVAELGIDDVVEPLPAEVAVEIVEQDVDRARRVGGLIIDRAMRGDDEVRGRPERGESRRQRLGVEDIEHRARELALAELVGERVIIHHPRAAEIDHPGMPRQEVELGAADEVVSLARVRERRHQGNRPWAAPWRSCFVAEHPVDGAGAAGRCG